MPAFGRRRRTAVTVAVLGSLVALSVTVAAATALGRPLTDLTREPQHALDAPVWIGGFAVVVMLVWWCSATIALFTAAVGRSERLEFLLLGSAIAFLVVDDAFQIHEVVLPELGIHQMLVYTAYAAVFLTLVALGRHFLARHDARLFVAAVAVLAISVAIDVAQDYAPLFYSRIAENGAKLLGIALLLVFTAGAAADQFRHGDIR